MLALKLGFKSGGQLNAFIAEIPLTFSRALNDSLANTRDRLITESWPAAVQVQAVRGSGRRSTTVRRKEAGRNVFRLQRSDEQNLKGEVLVNTKDEADTPGGTLTRSQVRKFLSSATPQEWIRGFVNSTHRVFVGKTRKERIRMALGAYYRLKRTGALRQAIAQRSESDIFQAFLARDFTRFMLQHAERRFPYRAKQAIRDANASSRSK